MTQHTDTAAQPTVFGPACQIRGDISIDGDAVILGTIEGDVEAAGRIEIGEEGSIRGNVQAGSMSILGRIEGDVRCDDVLEMSGHIEGNIACGKIEIDSSATLVGNLRAKVIAISEGAIYRGEVYIGPEALDELPESRKAAENRSISAARAAAPAEADDAGHAEADEQAAEIETTAPQQSSRPVSGLLRRRSEMLSRNNGAKA